MVKKIKDVQEIINEHSEIFADNVKIRKIEDKWLPLLKAYCNHFDFLDETFESGFTIKELYGKDSALYVRFSITKGIEHEYDIYAIYQELINNLIVRTALLNDSDYKNI